ncbi:NUDIX hydrolase [Geosporobacter ferrireducens]|uniref:DNA mismatch repair protein MutT n=1 Tax=Geosporobacter ferrireducens TaxID=1424294 RepID=A0A1D8GDT2_9FIRM|nr:8-oxo-dGTP diphosphatase [Geosporobacter ferrireducens]AOT69066.1 DNA mismatch repair protein MutT [Geosporobacter ferrireducens]MTI56738.1 8-oxo-dGTP diphosphatase [Geosporobacter ferrireducens]
MKLSTICYIEQGDQYLMLHRIKKENDVHHGKWIGLGGKMETGETPEECIIREVKEESGLTIHAPVLKGILTFPKFKDDEDWYVFLFTANRFTGKIIESAEGVLQWVDKKEVLNLDLWEGDRLFLQWMEENKFFSGKIIYEKGCLIKSKVNFYE